MNRGLLFGGLSLVVGGGLLYWYVNKYGWPQPPPSQCSQYNNNPLDCANDPDCHYCPDGTCRSINNPCDYDLCSQGIGFTCHSGIEGMKSCDRYNNLCECQTPNWVPVEENSYNCINNISHTDCFINQDNQAFCIKTYEQGIDKCTSGYDYGCPCGDIITCKPDTSFCDLRVNRCIRRAFATNITADWGTDDTYDSNCSWDQDGQTAEYEFDQEWAASTLTGTFSWEWGGIGNTELWIDVWLDGPGWTNIYYRSWDNPGATGSFQLSQTFAAQGIKKLRFKMCGWMANIKPLSFYGTLSM